MEDLNKIESSYSIGKLNKGSCDPFSMLCCSLFFGLLAGLAGLAGLAYFIYTMVVLYQ